VSGCVRGVAESDRRRPQTPVQESGSVDAVGRTLRSAVAYDVARGRWRRRAVVATLGDVASLPRRKSVRSATESRDPRSSSSAGHHTHTDTVITL